MKKFLFLLSVLFLVTIPIVAQKTASNNQITKQQELEQQIKDLQTKFDNLEYKTNLNIKEIDAVTTNTLERHGERIGDTQHFIYWILGFLAFYGLFISYTNRSETKKAIKDLNSAKKLQDEARQECEMAKMKMNSMTEEIVSIAREKINAFVNDSEANFRGLVVDEINKMKSESEKENNYASLISEGFHLGNKKEYLKAISKFKEAIELIPNRAVAFYNISILFRDLYYETSDISHLRGSLNSINAAISIEPNNHVYYSNKGINQLLFGDIDNATTSFKKALELHSSTENKLDLIEVLLISNKIDEAKNIFEKINDTDSKCESSVLAVRAYLEALEDNTEKNSLQKIKDYNGRIKWNTKEFRRVLNNKYHRLTEKQTGNIEEVLNAIDSNWEKYKEFKVN